LITGFQAKSQVANTVLANIDYEVSGSYRNHTHCGSVFMGLLNNFFIKKASKLLCLKT